MDGIDYKMLNIYDIIDKFVENTGYNHKRITIVNGNMIDLPYKYKIVKNPKHWYEVVTINQWLDNNNLIVDYKPRKYFGCFVGRSNWQRIWISAYLWSTQQNKTIQTFHSGFHCNYVIPKSDGITDRLGLDDLDYYDCDYWPEIIKFLQNAPINIDELDLKKIKSQKKFINTNNNDCYPIQHPSNLNILQHYNNFFVDIVCESSISGEVFFLTEKTFRPIIARRPFILLGNRESMRNLRKLGFKTFDQWWDEDYDDYDEKQRIKMVTRLIDEISGWTLSKLHDVLIEMQTTLDHNHDTFRQLTTCKIKEVFDE